MIYVGIDPGQNGGISWIDEKGKTFVIPMVEPEELNSVIWNWQAELGIKHICIEKAQPMPRQGVSSMFNFGNHFGALRGVIIANELPYTLVPPKTWQKTMFVGTKASIKPKERAMAAAKSLFPHERFLATTRCKKLHDGMIDSILIAEYCRRTIR